MVAGLLGHGKAWWPPSRYRLILGYLLAVPEFSVPLLLSLALERGPALLRTGTPDLSGCTVMGLTPDSSVIF